MARTAATSDRRIEILKSAAAAFRRRGYHGASVDEIASALEMTKGNLYYYFKNKEDILFACHDYSLDLLLALMADVQAEASSPEAKLRRLVLAFVHLILDELHATALTLDPGGAVAAAVEEDHRQARPVRSRHARHHPAGHRPGRLHARRSQVDRVCDDGRDQLDRRSGSIPTARRRPTTIGDAFADYLVGGLLKKHVSPGLSFNTSIPLPARWCSS